ncbi:MAG: hypothetical protein AAFQ65_13520 [Myxococcota bacterium]
MNPRGYPCAAHVLCCVAAVFCLSLAACELERVPGPATPVPLPQPRFFEPPTAIPSVDTECLTEALEATVQVPRNDAQALLNAVFGARPGEVIELEGGAYYLPDFAEEPALSIFEPGVTLRGAGDSAADTVIDGSGTTKTLLGIYSSSVRVENLTVQNADVLIVIDGSSQDASNAQLLRVHALDMREAGIRVLSGGGRSADGFVIGCTHIGASRQLSTRLESEPVGVTVEGVRYGAILGNTIESRLNTNLGLTGIRILGGSRDIRVARNLVSGAEAAVQIGLVEESLEPRRSYDDELDSGCANLEVIDSSSVRLCSNFIVAEGVPGARGIDVVNSCAISIHHTTIVVDDNQSSLSAAFAEAEWVNNAFSGDAVVLDSAALTRDDANTAVSLADFVDPETGRWDTSVIAPQTVDAGVAMADCAIDLVGSPRDDPPNIGAVE